MTDGVEQQMLIGWTGSGQSWRQDLFDGREQLIERSRAVAGGTMTHEFEGFLFPADKCPDHDLHRLATPVAKP